MKVGDNVSIPCTIVEVMENGMVVLETEENGEGGAPNRFAVLESQVQPEIPLGRSPEPKESGEPVIK